MGVWILSVALAGAGLLRRGVPVSMGGDGAPFQAVVAAARTLPAEDPASAWIFRAQHHAIQLLMHAENVALREFLLSQWLQGERAGTVLLDAASHALLATIVGHASGQPAVGRVLGGGADAAPIPRG